MFQSKEIEKMGSINDSSWDLMFEENYQSPEHDYLLKVIKIGIAKGEVCKMLTLILFKMIHTFTFDRERCFNGSINFVKT